MLTMDHPTPVVPEHLPPSTALLERFYARTGLPLPRLELLRGDEVPSPYQELLVHSADMTPTLEAFWQRPLGLTVLRRVREGESYLREVVLKVALEGWPVEYGAIRIHLSHFPPRARRLVLEEQRPLGKILEVEAVAHLSWPQAFFRVQSDAHMSDVLHLAEPCALYGRRNVLLDGNRRLLAEVIEILAPVEQRSKDSN
jgi:chorismate-pyruvate lyase